MEPVVLERSWLRHAVVIALVDLGGRASVAELVRRLDEMGIGTHRNASRAVSDSLRWEIHKGRVRRSQRGQYAVCVPPLTKRHVKYARQRVRDRLADRR